MSEPTPAPLSYDVFVSDGPAGAGDERMPDGAPLAWSCLSSTLIFGAQDAVLVDPPFTRTQIQAAGDWVERSGRRLDYIYATHPHGDHWLGPGDWPGASPAQASTPLRARSRSCAGGPAQAASSCSTESSRARSPRTRCSPNPFPQGFRLEGNPVVAVETGHTDTDQNLGAARALHRPGRGR